MSLILLLMKVRVNERKFASAKMSQWEIGIALRIKRGRSPLICMRQRPVTSEIDPRDEDERLVERFDPAHLSTFLTTKVRK